MRRYTADLSAVLFDTGFFAGSSIVLDMAVDSLGYTDIVGVASGVNLPQANPTQTCVPLSSADGTEFNAFLIRFDGGGDLIQSSYLQALVNAGPGSIPVLPKRC